MCARASTGNGRKRGASSISLSAAPLPFSHLGSSASFTGFFVFPLLFFSPLSIVLQHFAQQIKEEKKQEANEKNLFLKFILHYKYDGASRILKWPKKKRSILFWF